MNFVEDLKLAVVNFSGNVGKTVVASQLLFPRMKDCEYYHVETINAGNEEGETMAASNYSQLLDGIEMADSCVVDVGSSNIEVFLSQMQNFKNSHDEIDFFILPVTPSNKEKRDTEALVDFLMNMGIPKNKLRVVFNQVDRQNHAPEKELDFFDKSLMMDIAGKNPAIIYNSDYYPMLQSAGKQHLDVLQDERDFNAMKKAAESKADKYEVVLEKKLFQAAQSAEEDLVKAFNNLELTGA